MEGSFSQRNRNLIETDKERKLVDTETPGTKFEYEE